MSYTFVQCFLLHPVQKACFTICMLCMYICIPNKIYYHVFQYVRSTYQLSCIHIPLILCRQILPICVNLMVNCENARICQQMLYVHILCMYVYVATCSITFKRLKHKFSNLQCFSINGEFKIKVDALEQSITYRRKYTIEKSRNILGYKFINLL